MPDVNGDGTYSAAIGVHHPERFEAYAWFTIDAAGKMTVFAYSLNLLDAPVLLSKEALMSFKRLCTAD